MDVTVDNFAFVLPSLLADIAGAHLIAIDTELSGLQSATWLKSLPIDTLDSRWCRTRASSVSFGLLQFGVATFTYDDAAGAFIVRPYSFYLHPRVSQVGLDMGTSGWGGETAFTVQASSLTFLSNNKFDFNKLFAKGACGGGGGGSAGWARWCGPARPRSPSPSLRGRTRRCRWARCT